MLSLLVALLVLTAPVHLFAENTYIYTPFGPVRVKVKPVSEIKHRGIVKQRYDYSCGAAVLATLFKYYFGEEVDEKSVIETLFRVGDVEKIKKRQGFSMLDLKRYAVLKGYRATGYKATVEDLVRLGVPAIVAIDVGNYRHFVIFKGVYKGRVLLADPALGNTVVSVGEFRKMWVKNIALVIRPKDGDFKKKGISEEDLVIVRDEFLRQVFVPQSLPVYRSIADF
ncbi:MAG: C39 family peptidase [Aquificota bacterium]|nr:C39 family peptidase [Aquificota bacterium]